MEGPDQLQADRVEPVSRYRVSGRDTLRVVGRLLGDRLTGLAGDPPGKRGYPLGSLERVLEIIAHQFGLDREELGLTGSATAIALIASTFRCRRA